MRPVVPDQTAGARFAQVQNPLKALDAAVIRVWNLPFVHALREFEEQPQFVCMVARAYSPQVVQVNDNIADLDFIPGK